MPPKRRWPCSLAFAFSMAWQGPHCLAQRLASAVALLCVPSALLDCSPPRGDVEMLRHKTSITAVASEGGSGMTPHGEVVMLQHKTSITAVAVSEGEGGINPHVAALDDCSVKELSAGIADPHWIFDGRPAHRSRFQSKTSCMDVRHVEPDSSNGTCDTRQNTSNVKKVAVLLRGEVFRRQKWDNEESSQVATTRSQVRNLVQPLERAGYEVDVYVVTSLTKHDSSWMGLFSTRLKSSRQLKPLRGMFTNHQGRHVAAALDLVQSAIAQSNLTYRFIVMLRNDLMLKHGDFVEKILNDSRTDTTFLFPFMTYDAAFRNPSGHPDTIQILPQRLLQCYRDSLLCEGAGFRSCSFAREFLFYNMRCRLGRTKVGFLYSLTADPDSAKCANPVYLQADRIPSERICSAAHSSMRLAAAPAPAKPAHSAQTLGILPAELPAPAPNAPSE